MTSLRALAETAAVSPQAVRRLWQATTDGPGTKRLVRAQWVPTFVRGDGEARVVDEPYTLLAGAALRFGEAFLALDIAREGGAALETALRPQATGEDEARALHGALSQLGHVEALVLARTGSTAAAQERLGEFLAQDRDNPEITGALARTCKDFAVGAAHGSDLCRNYLRQSHHLYLDGYRRSRPRSPYLGINAAATALWLGEHAQSAALAHEVENICRAELIADPSGYWPLATMAEAYLLAGQPTRAADLYAQARAVLEPTRR